MTTKPTLKLVHSSEIAEKSKKLPADYEGEMLLIWSVLYRAMLDALGHYRVSSEDSYSIVEDARDWIGVYDDSTQDDLYKAAPFSYEWACLMLGLDPYHGTKVRKGRDRRRVPAREVQNIRRRDAGSRSLSCDSGAETVRRSSL
jgi:hypothetical protein